MEEFSIILIAALALCYAYAFVSGFTDAANAIATSVGSRCLSPLTAVLMAGALEIAGAMSGTAVALTIGKGIVDLQLITLTTVIAGLLGAMAWSLLTYAFGIPVSETHGLIGGVIGAGLAAGGLNAVLWGGLTKVLLAIILSPLFGFLGGMLLMGIIAGTCSSAPARHMQVIFRNLQRLSSAFMAFSHGMNDAQKPMGMIVMVIAVHTDAAASGVPLWVILTVGLVAGLGVAWGGWRIVKTLGFRMTRLRPEQGFAAETAAASMLEMASFFGIPVSTTHTITASIVGAGAARSFKRVRWELFIDVVISWILTLPATIAFGWLFAKALMFLSPVP